MVITDVEKIEHTIEGVAEVGVHPVALFNLMKKNRIVAVVHFGVDFVVHSLGETLGVVLEKGGFAAKDVANAQQVDFTIEASTHTNYIEILYSYFEVRHRRQTTTPKHSFAFLYIKAQ
jgi:hypothetical protein